nr:hypothetical protein [uncultured organism]
MTDVPASRRKILVGGGAATLGIAAIALLFVLPSEYGIDPTGVGTAIGLTRLSEPNMTPELERGAKRKGVLTITDDGTTASEPGRRDHWDFDLGPYESIEFKYRLAKGAAMTFVWQTSAPVRYDMHSHPFVGGTALTESYGVGTAARMRGRYVAAFDGIHGWYWQNRTLEHVTLRLDASGAFAESMIFDSTGERKRPIASLQ